MYESFYGFTGKPFSLLPDADCLFPSKHHKRILNLLEYSTLNQSGFMVISGEVGAGKTTAIRHYLKKLGPDITVGIITNPSESFGNLFSWIAMAYDFEDAGEDRVKSYSHFVAFLLEQYAKGQRTLLIIDEAQNLSLPVLEDLRMLSNVNNEKDQLLQIILVGQPELLDTLKNPALRQFVQRITIHCHLTPLNARETAQYVRHRLSTAGGAPTLFDDKACAAVYYFTQGVPRLINLLCDQALMYAFAEDKKTVDCEAVLEVAGDRESGGLSSFTSMKGRSADAVLQDLSAIISEIKGSAHG